MSKQQLCIYGAYFEKFHKNLRWDEFGQDFSVEPAGQACTVMTETYTVESCH